MKTFLYQDAEVSEEEFVAILLDHLIFTSLSVVEADKELNQGTCINIYENGNNHRFEILNTQTETEKS